MIRLNELRIQNFRCIREGVITFSRDVTILVADNGIGKTTVLDAIALVLAQFVDEFTQAKQSPGLRQSDVRLEKDIEGHQTPRTPTVLQVFTDLNGRRVNWTGRRKLHAETPRRSLIDVASIVAVTNELRASISRDTSAKHDVVLPLVAYYRSNRFALNNFFGSSELRRIRTLDGRLSGYRIYLDPLSDSLHFNKWYRRMFLAVKNHPVTGAYRSDSYLQQLTAVNEAVEHVLESTGWRQIDWDETEKCVVAHHPDHGELPLSMLSSGIRTTIALIADLAHRCARLNPLLGPNIAKLTPGVVLIDEVDLHLHPAWQQLIVDLLRTAFPAVQFILSTHSPQVLSTVDSSEIRVIKLQAGMAEMKSPLLQTRGVESADVLARVMEVDPIPEVEQAEWLSSYRAMVQFGNHESEAGNALWQQLLNHFGKVHPVLTEIDVVRRLQDFKRSNGIRLN
jgi:predicted ATP-binding protein involved in virulence